MRKMGHTHFNVLSISAISAITYPKTAISEVYNRKERPLKRVFVRVQVP